MIAFLFALVVLGAAFYIVETYLPMAPPFRIVFRVVVVLILLWYFLALVGIAPSGLRAPFP